MRYIGNKTRLLPFILRTLKKSQIPVGTVHDAFAGTASVSRALKAEGWRDLTLLQRAKNEWKEPRLVSDVPHDAKEGEVVGLALGSSVSGTLRTQLRRRQGRHRDLRDCEAILRVECVGGGVRDFLLTVGGRVNSIEADVLPERSRAGQEGA